MKPVLFVLLIILLPMADLYAQQKSKPASRPSAASTDAKVSSDLAFLKKMKDASLTIDIENKSLKSRIMKLVGTRYSFMKRLADTGGPATPVELKDDIYSGFVCKAHDCADNNFIVAGDVKNNILHVGIRENGKAQVYSENNAAAPQAVTDWLTQKK